MHIYGFIAILLKYSSTNINHTPEPKVRESLPLINPKPKVPMIEGEGEGRMFVVYTVVA